MDLTPIQRALIDGWQRAFPLQPRPFEALAEGLAVTQAEVLAELTALRLGGVLSRIGATVRPNTVGASLLAAMAIAPQRLHEVADIVSREACVNHNYEREHAFNLWFVVTAPDVHSLSEALARLRRATGHDILELPMERAYYLDLGFPLTNANGSASETWKRAGAQSLARTVSPLTVTDADRCLLAALQDGLALVERPYRLLGEQCGCSEQAAIARIAQLTEAGIVSRFGLIVRHRAVGITANAMAVWNVPDDDADAIGAALAGESCVTLCYRRTRRPHWPYNLFAMVHGRERAIVERQIAALAERHGLGAYEHALLFSRRCFVQRGARFKAA